MGIVCNEWLFLDCMQNTVTKLPIFDFQFLNAYNLIESLIIVPLIYIFIDSSDVWMCSGDMKKIHSKSPEWTNFGALSIRLGGLILRFD